MTLDEARRRLPLDLLMAHLGHHEAAKSRARSPFREDKTPSFGIYQSPDGRLRWKDHATGEGGDEIDYLAAFYEISQADAQKKYLELAGHHEPEQRTGKYRVKKKTEEEPRTTPPPVFSWKAYQERATEELIANIAKERSLSPEVFQLAHKLGIFGATDDGHPAFVVNGGSACHYRVQDGSWRYEPRGAAATPLCFGNPDAAEAWVFESQWDALAILDGVGHNKIESTLFVVTRGANNGKLAKVPCDGKIVTAWPQNDAVKANGKVPSEEWLKDVRACTNQCKIVRIPGPFKDANDWVEGGATASQINTAIGAAMIPELAGIEVFSIKSLLDFQPKEDDTALLGDRWLCRGGSCLIVGPAGIGKSSLAAQKAVLWALGLPAFGIAPKRPLKSVFMQAENDEGDMAEMVQGVIMSALGSCREHGITTEEAMALLSKNLVIARDTIHSGDSFAVAADALANLHKPDLFWCDPLLSYVGDDISSQKVASNFLRGKLNPISFRHGFAWMMVHHTGKPPSDAKSRQKWTESDFAYIGIGSSELTNWARACVYLEQLEDGIFALRLTKRGKRAGVATKSGFSITKIGLQHGEKHICWEPCDLPEEGEKPGDLSKIQLDEVILHRQNGLSLSKIIEQMGLKNSKGTPMGKGQLCKILAAYEAKTTNKSTTKNE
jgi:hypothetical protein